MGGEAPHTTPVRARPPSLGAICAASWRVGAGSLVLRGPCGSRRQGRGGGSRSGPSLGWGGGPTPPAPGGEGRGPRGLRAGGGGGGGGRAAASLPPFWPAACGTPSWPPSRRRRTPLRRARAVGVAVPPRGGEAGPYGHSSRLSFDSFFCHIKQIKVRRVRRRQSATSRAAHYDSSAQFIKRLYFYEFWVAIFLIIKFSSFVYCCARRCYHVSSCGGPCKGRKIIRGRQGLRRSRGLPRTWEHENQCLSCSIHRVRRRAGLR